MDYLQEPACTRCAGTVFPKKQPITFGPSTALGFLVFILPKCPLCVVAYTSSMAICGAPSIVDHHTGWGAWLAIGLAGLCLMSIVKNYRGAGTRAAILIALLGIFLLLIGLFTPNNMNWYYVGAAFLWLSSFYNGRGYRWLHKLSKYKLFSGAY